MGKCYKQLTLDERYAIFGYCKAGFSKKRIAEELQRRPTTIGREIRRNTGRRGYRPLQAHTLAMSRRKNAKKAHRLTPAICHLVICKLSEQWSPEQISGWLRHHMKMEISHEAIYQYILTDKEKGGTLYKNLRRSNRKRKKRYGGNDRRGRIRNRISIDQRPSCVDTKERLGDWEGDTVIGKNHQSALVTLVERKSKRTLVGKVDRYTSHEVNKTIERMLQPYQEYLHTITLDNGREFAGHEALSEKTGAEIYFAHPYHSWERGLNENTNGLIRQYVPKQTDLRSLSDTRIYQIQERLNTRPRKALDYLSPYEQFIKDQNVN